MHHPPPAASLDAEPSPDEQLQAELDFAEDVFGWRPSGSSVRRIGRSGDCREWTVYDRDLDDPRARQIAVYYADRPQIPDRAAAQRWNDGRQRAVSHYARLDRQRRRREREALAPSLSRPAVVVPLAPRRTARPRGAGRPRAQATRSSARSGDGPSDSEPHQTPVDPSRPAPSRAVLLSGAKS